jgi:glycosyltransferase 2 family protein
MKKRILKTVQYLAFFAVGIFLFWLVYRDMDMQSFKQELTKINLWWIAVSFLFSILSHISRAIRWNMLIRPLGYNPRTINTFLSVLVMYLTNLIVPRAGELARCTVLGRNEKIPFTKLVGTVVIERTTDLVAMIVFAIGIILLQWSVFSKFLVQHPDVNSKLSHLFSPLHILVCAIFIVGFILFLLAFRKRIKETSLFKKISHLYYNFTEGIKAIGKLENKWSYIGHTVFIYIMWLFALYVVFLSYPPTRHLTILTGMATFVMGGLAMIAPVQGGIGPWHFMVYETLFIYGIDKPFGKIFALIAHTTTNLFLLILGVVALMILPAINRKKGPVETADVLK